MNDIIYYFDSLLVTIDRTDIKDAILHRDLQHYSRLVQENKTKENMRAAITLPETNYSLPLLIIFDCLTSVLNGNNIAARTYSKGQKLKFGTCIVEYIGEKQHPNIRRKQIHVKLSDVEIGIDPIYSKYLHKTDTNRTLSPQKTYLTNKKKINEKLNISDVSDESQLIIQELFANKTNIEKPVLLLDSPSCFFNVIEKIKIKGEPVLNFLIVARGDEKGCWKIENSGQFDCIPAIILASDLYIMHKLLKGNPELEKSPIYINGTNLRSIDSYLDSYDQISARKNSVFLVSDYVSLFDLSVLFKRTGFDFFQPKEYENKKISQPKNIIDHSFRNLFTKQWKIDTYDHPGIEKCFNDLRFIRDTASKFVYLNDLYRILNSVFFNILHTCYPLSVEQRLKFVDEIEKGFKNVASEKNYIDQATYRQLEQTVELTLSLLNDKQELPKIQKIKELLLSQPEKHFYLVVRESQEEKERANNYWTSFCSENQLSGIISILTLSEYIKEPVDSAIITRWFKKEKMRNIIFSFYKSEELLLLCYPETIFYDAFIESSKKMFHDIKIPIKGNSYIGNFLKSEIGSCSDGYPDEELEDFEPSDKTIKIRKYQIAPQEKSGNGIEVIPISFTDGSLLFCKPLKKLIVVNMSQDGSDQAFSEKKAEELHENDVLVFRDSQSDIIREIADNILIKEGQENLRKMAELWKFHFQSRFQQKPFDKTQRLLRRLGCKRNYLTIKNWINDEDIIAPESLDDIKLIAKSINNNEMLTKAQEIIDAAKSVRSVHVQAGRILSERLKTTLHEDLMNLFDNDGTVEYNIPDIGNINLLKIDSIEGKILINPKDVNILIKD